MAVGGVAPARLQSILQGIALRLPGSCYVVCTQEQGGVIRGKTPF